jgi:hypothetical protein
MRRKPVPEASKERLTGRTVATTRRGGRIIAEVTTRHYAAESDTAVTPESNTATDEQLDAVIAMLKGIRSQVQHHTKRG